jgi:hypothetical protein
MTYLFTKPQITAKSKAKIYLNHQIQILLIGSDLNNIRSNKLQSDRSGQIASKCFRLTYKPQNKSMEVLKSK